MQIADRDPENWQSRPTTGVCRAAATRVMMSAVSHRGRSTSTSDSPKGSSFTNTSFPPCRKRTTARRTAMNTMRRTPVDLKPVRPARFIQVLAFLVACGTLILALASTPFVGPLAFSKDGRSLIGVVNGTWSLNWNDPLSSRDGEGLERNHRQGAKDALGTISLAQDNFGLAQWFHPRRRG